MTGPIVKAMRKVSTHRFVARAIVETEAPEVVWRFLVACVVEHGGEATTEEICQHLVGAPRHPFIERLLELARAAGGLGGDPVRWTLGPTAREILSTGTRRISRTGEYEFHIDPDWGGVISVRRQKRPESLWTSISTPTIHASDAEMRQIRDAVGRRFADGATLLGVEDPILVAGRAEDEVLAEISLTSEQLDELISAALPSDFDWDAARRVARSDLRTVVDQPQLLATRTITTTAISRFSVKGMRPLKDVVVERIPWEVRGEIEEKELRLVTMLSTVHSVQDRNLWPDTLSRAGVQISRQDGAVMARRWGMDLAYKMLMAAEDWRL